MDRIPERLRTAAEGVARATQMMADAKSKLNGDGACYGGLSMCTGCWDASGHDTAADCAIPKGEAILWKRTWPSHRRVCYLALKKQR